MPLVVVAVIEIAQSGGLAPPALGKGSWTEADARNSIPPTVYPNGGAASPS